MKLRRFSIRSLFVLTLVVAIVLAIPFGQAAKQKIGREWVGSQRGHVFFEGGYDGQSSQHVPYVPQFVVQLIGVDLFSPVRAVLFDCDELVDLKPIENMPSLYSIEINIEMDDAIDFSPLAKLPNLRVLHFTKWSGVSAEQLVEIRDLLPRVKVTSETW